MNRVLNSIVYAMFGAAIVGFLAYLILKLDLLAFVAAVLAVVASVIYLIGKKVSSNAKKRG